jgi:hypothetical protein
MPQVMGEAGSIVAILRADRDAQHSPSLPGTRSKIPGVSGVPLTAPGPGAGGRDMPPAGI